jgi:hypothetical protein
MTGTRTRALGTALVGAIVTAAAVGVVGVPCARAASAQELARNSSQALRDLYAKE